MGIIRLSLITLVLLGLGMMYFGRDEGLPDTRLGRTPTPEPTVEAFPEDEPGAAQVATDETATPAIDDAPADPALDAALAEALSTPEPEAPAPEPEPVAAETAPAAAPEPAPPAPVATPEPAPTARLYVSGGRVNVRSGPSTVYGVITALTRGELVEDLGDAGEGWRRIRLATGEEGYMSGDFLSPDPQ